MMDQNDPSLLEFERFYNMSISNLPPGTWVQILINKDGDNTFDIRYYDLDDTTTEVNHMLFKTPDQQYAGETLTIVVRDLRADVDLVSREFRYK